MRSLGSRGSRASSFSCHLVLVLKLETFYNLGYTSDLFVLFHLLEAGLRVVAYFRTTALLLPLGLMAKPFGAPGLLFVLAASVGAAYFWATRILRLLGLDARVALTGAGLVLISSYCSRRGNSVAR